MPVFIVHIGDVHLQAGHPRNADRLASLDEIIGDNAARASLWLVPGDLFHQKSTAQDRNDLAARLLRMATVAPVLLVRGNHDAPGDLDIFAKLSARWPIAVVTSPQIVTLTLPTGDTAAIAGVPYPDKVGLVALGVAPGDVPQTAAQLLDVIFMQLAHELAVAQVGGNLPLFAGHFNVRGSVACTGQPQIGVEQEIDRLSLERLPAVYCALSHIHEPQEVGRGVYAGSIAAMDYGETTHRSYVLVTAERQADGSWAAAWTRESLDTPRMFHVEGRVDPTGFYLASDCDEEIGRRACNRDWAGCDVRLRYTYKASERGALPSEDAIRKHFAGALRLKIESVAEPDRELRSPAVAAAKTLTEKLAAYRKESTLTPSVADKLALIEHGGDSLLAIVAERLKAIEQPERIEVAA